MSNEGGPAVFVLARRLVLGLVLLGGAAVLVLVEPQRCAEQVADGRVVETCEPLPATSPLVLVYLLVVAMLLAPEVAELEITGLLKLKRDVAEARAESAEVRAVVAELVATNRADAHSVATGGEATGGHAAVNVVFGRDALTAASLTGLQDDTGGGVEVGAPELDPQSEEVGEGALVAFSAGLVGLSATLPKMPGDSSESVLVGLTLTAERDGLEATHDPDEAKPDLVERAVHLLNEDFPPRGGVLAVGVDGWIFASPACDGAGGLVGALVAIVSPPPVDAEDLADPSSGAAAGSESMAAALDVAADGYARLLIDLLGEQALPPAGAQRTDRGS